MEEEEGNQQHRMKILAVMMSEMNGKGTMNANNSWWVSDLLSVDWKKGGFIQNGKTQCSDGTTDCTTRRRRRRMRRRGKKTNTRSLFAV